jgi:hypothetical protein
MTQKAFTDSNSSSIEGCLLSSSRSQIHFMHKPTQTQALTVKLSGDFLYPWQTVLTHPFFTGHCPDCHGLLSLRDSLPGQSLCRACHWSDRADDA